jgi:hypothetical protein
LFETGENVPNLNFKIESVAAVARAAAPMLNFRIRITSASAEPVHAIALECRIFIAVPPREYTQQDLDRLDDLFGEPSRWGQFHRPMLWTRASLVVPAFTGTTVCDLQAPCSFDFDVAATKYFYGLEQGSAPLRFEFSGTMFDQSESGTLRMSPVPAGIDARFALQAHIWTDMMEEYYPDSLWLRLPRDIFDRLSQYKSEQRIPTWEDMLERMLPGAPEVVQ